MIEQRRYLTSEWEWICFWINKWINQNDYLIICELWKSCGCTQAWNSVSSTRIHSSVTTGMISWRPTTSRPCRRRSFTPSSTSGIPVVRLYIYIASSLTLQTSYIITTRRLTAEETEEEESYASYLFEYRSLCVLLHVQLIHCSDLYLKLQLYCTAGERKNTSYNALTIFI